MCVCLRVACRSWLRLTSRRLHARFCKRCMYMRPCTSLRECVRGRERMCRCMCISLSHDRCWLVRHYSCSFPSSSAGPVRIAAASRVAHASAVAVAFVFCIRCTRCQKLCGAHRYRRKLSPSVLPLRVTPGPFATLCFVFLQLLQPPCDAFQAAVALPLPPPPFSALS